MCLKGSLDMFRKSHEVSMLILDPIGVKLRGESNPCKIGLNPPFVFNFKTNTEDSWNLFYIL